MAGDASEEVIYRVEDSGVAWLILNRPEAGNSLTREQRSYILQHLEDAGADLGVRAIVLTASGDRHFCTGGDLRAAAASEKRTFPGAPERPIGTVMKGLESSLGAQRLLVALQDCPKPIIAAVNGTAAGLGAHVAFACDLVIAADTARFIEIFVRRGLIPDGGGPYLVTQLVGPQKAKELFFFGDDVPAEEACRIGLINRVVPAAELEASARVGRAPGGRADGCDRADQATGELRARERPGGGVQGRGPGARGRHAVRRQQRRRAVVRRAAAHRVQGLVRLGCSRSPARCSTATGTSTWSPT